MISAPLLEHVLKRHGGLFALAGWSGSGKTTLAEKLIAELTARGLNMATIKHAHHNFEADIEGKDSYRHRKAGAAQVLVSSAKRAALFSEHDKEPSLAELVERLAPADIVLVEGFKTEPMPKLEIWRAEVGKPTLYPHDPHILALASDKPVADCTLPQLRLDDISAISDFVLANRWTGGALAVGSGQ